VNNIEGKTYYQTEVTFIVQVCTDECTEYVAFVLFFFFLHVHTRKEGEGDLN
jgi:hypothetical protein